MEDKISNVDSGKIENEKDYKLVYTNEIDNLTKQGKPLAKKVNVLDIVDKSRDLQLCLSQQYQPFGFLPITNLCQFGNKFSSIPNEVYNSTEFDPVKVHHKVLATGKYNFQEARIQVPSDINFELLEKVCIGYWDWQLPLLLKFGFPLDFPDKARGSLVSTEENHASARNFPQDIRKYLDTEISHKAIMGPFKQPPFGKTTQISPFMSRPKPDSEHRRIIVDLSWPEKASVNYFTLDNVYLNTTFKLQYPTIDAITNYLSKLGKNAVIYKIDLSRAFRQIPIDPHDYNLLCLKWQDAYFCDVRCPFGEKIGSSLCTRLTDLFRHLAFKRGHMTFTYVDDVIGTSGPDSAVEGFEYLRKLLEELNFPISESKLVAPTEETTCLGIIINANKQTLSVPDKKLQEILSKCRETLHKKWVTKSNFQSVLGSLMFIHKCVKPTRIFTNRLLECLRQSVNKKVHITEEVRKDLRWFLEFLPKFNGTTTYVHVLPHNSHTIAIDACLEGLRGIWDDKVYSVSIPAEFRKEKLSITHFEMLNIIVALNIWKDAWVGKHIEILVDNMAVVTICKSGFTRDRNLASYARNIWLITSLHDIQLKITHVPGYKNKEADLLSIWQNGGVNNLQKLHQWVPNFQWEIVKQEYFKINYDI